MNVCWLIHSYHEARAWLVLQWMNLRLLRSGSGKVVQSRGSGSPGHWGSHRTVAPRRSQGSLMCGGKAARLAFTWADLKIQVAGGFSPQLIFRKGQFIFQPCRVGKVGEFEYLLLTCCDQSAQGAHMSMWMFPFLSPACHPALYSF